MSAKRIPSPIALLDKREYFAELTAKVRATKRGERVAITSMTFDPEEEPAVQSLLSALYDAADRGVHVTLLVDAHSFMISGKDLPSGPLLRRTDVAHGNANFRSKLQALETLKKHGGSYAIINKPSKRLSNPFAGRSHIKIAVVNDDSYVGGCNLSTLQVDAMVRLDEPKLADWLYNFTQQVRDTGSVRETLLDTDQTIPVDDFAQLIIDAGVPNQSTIYDEALRLIDEANEWIVFTCQFFPNGQTILHLAKALERGVHVYLFYNHPSKHSHIHKLAHHLVVLHERSRWPRELFKRQIAKQNDRIHAKIIATDQAAVIGSHNYVPAGVKFGTAEASVLSNDPAFAREVAHFVTVKLGVDDVI
ncbi:MAG TPA: phospholipase D-like domain-containing protein [Candidatus Saccharimonadales bacterium]|jgi:phosphatidylserine/phosphatidylglycerophosphate/cardiolipin synthase-like enzyme|nr:phospholipase D-like domain-containing protein [Candidatus Saccharimonadales bacterium]